MSYKYKSKESSELEAIAGSLLARFPSCIQNGKPDIENIVEAAGIMVIPKAGLNKLTVLDAYLPRRKGIILIDADLSTDLSIYRLTLAEEISHQLLEPELWENGVPDGANIYELDKQLYDDVEGDAYRLAIAIAMPEKCFRERFVTLKNQLSVDTSINDLDAVTIDLLAKEFGVTFNASASRCNMLNICKGKIQKKKLPGAVIF